jgi:hypothetical protein
MAGLVMVIAYLTMSPGQRGNSTSVQILFSIEGVIGKTRRKISGPAVQTG